MPKRPCSNESESDSGSFVASDSEGISPSNSDVEPASSPGVPVSPSAVDVEEVHGSMQIEDDDSNFESHQYDKNLELSYFEKPTAGTKQGSPFKLANKTLELDDMNLSVASESSDLEVNISQGNVFHVDALQERTATFHDGINCDVSSDSSDEDWDSDAGLSIHSDDEDLLENTEDYSSILDKSNEPVYNGAPITLSQSLLAVLAFSMRHNLNGKAIVDLLKLLSLHLRPEENIMKATLYFFKKHFSNLKAPVILHYFCSVCYSKLEDERSECPHLKSHKNKKKTQCSYFLEISLEHQLKTIFRRKDFIQHILSRFNRTKCAEQNIEDVYDGQLYKDLEAEGFFSGNKKHNITLTWNSDGVPVFKSSKTSMWPLFFVINEVPYKMRFKKSNVLIGGIWYGSKPIPNMMLEPFISSLTTLRKGIEVEPYLSLEKLTVQCILLVGTADLPAKADFMGLKHPSGSHSCAVCKIAGKSVKTSQESTQDLPPSDVESEEEEEEQETQPTKKKAKTDKEPVKKKREGSVWIFPYSSELDLRRHEENEKFALDALELNANNTGKNTAHVFGAKWPTLLSKLMPDMIRGMGIDDLHHSYHGVAHKLMELWFLPKYKKMPWSLSTKIALIDDRLQNIQLPNFVQCGVRTVSNLTLWKAKHMKTFILYLALPVLEGVLREVYFDHFAIFVHCLYTLNSTSISPQDLLYCSQKLDTFVRQFQEYYGERHMTMNVHNTLHLTFVVNNLGPMRCFSCFPFESLNGEMLRMIHGTKYVQMQLANCAYLLLCLPYEIESIKSATLRQFAKDLNHHKYHSVKCLYKVNDDIFVAGNYVDSNTVDGGTIRALDEANLNVSSCEFFSKLKKGPILFVAQCYRRATKTASYLVSYSSPNGKCYGIIRHFIKTSLNDRTLILASISPLTVQRFSDAANLKPIRHILRYVVKNEVELIDINYLQHICFSVSLKKGDLFLCERMNWLEME